MGSASVQLAAVGGLHLWTQCTAALAGVGSSPSGCLQPTAARVDGWIFAKAGMIETVLSLGRARTLTLDTRSHPFIVRVILRMILRPCPQETLHL